MTAADLNFRHIEDPIQRARKLNDLRDAVVALESGGGVGGGGGGTVTSVALTGPAGLVVSGSPVTTSGTLAITFDAGYSIPLTADTGKGVTAYGWGNHASAGYVVSGGALGTPSSGTLTNCTFPTLNQNTTGSAATLTTPRAIYGNNFDGSAALTQVIASTYGGTGNGFTKFSGPATSEKTFTLPDSSATILTSAAEVTVAQGGTGASTAANARANLFPSFGGNALKSVRVNAGETDIEYYTPAGGGNVVGPSSATDNAIARYDSTTGALIQDSAATVSDQGVIRSATNTGANPVGVPLVNWMMLTADYTLTSTTSEQKAFNTTTNGELTLPAGIYTFDCFLYVTTMSATSGNLAFDPIGGGTAVTDRWGQSNYGADSSTPLNAGTRTGSASVTQQTPASAATAGTGTGLAMSFTGMFRISTGGTIIPSVSLVTAAAAVVKAGSWFQISKIGESSETSLGDWS